MSDAAVFGTGGGARRASQEQVIALFITAAATGYAFIAAAGSIYSMPLMVKYISIYFGLVPTTLYLIFVYKKIYINISQLIILGILTLLFPISLLLGQGLTDIAGNYLRFLFVILAMLFWRASTYDENIVLDKTYRYFFVSSIAVCIFIILIQKAGIARTQSRDNPMLVLLFAYAFLNRKYLHLPVILFMSYVSGKESLYIAIFTIVFVQMFLNGRWVLGLIMSSLLVAYAFTDTFLVLEMLQASGGNFARLARFLLELQQGTYDEDLLNRITTNRYAEYQSVFADWQAGGIPFLGRGLGGTVNVWLEFRGTNVERSTLHNSYLLVFHILGIPGLLFVLYYLVAPVFSIGKHSRVLLLVHAGALAYGLFSNSLLQAPTFVFMMTLSFALLERSRRLGSRQPAGQLDGATP